MKLIIINGACGVGKSTLAEKVHKNRPLSFLLDIDSQRRNISGHREHKEQSGPMSLSIGRNILQTCMELKRDVIMEKMIFDSEVLDAYCEIAKDFNAEIYEIILWAPKEVVMNRAKVHGFRKGGLLTAEKCERFWYEIDKIKDVRSNAIVINTENLSEEDLYIQVLKILEK